MSFPFGRRRRPEAEALLRDIRARIEEMESRFRRIEESWSRPDGRQPPSVQIENVHIHQPVLEKLEFRLDALDIEQLSGSLNLGNNFGARWTSGRDAESAAAGARGGAAAESGRAGATAGHRASGSGGSSANAGAGSRDSAGAGGRSAPDPSADGLRATPSGFRWQNRR